MLVEKKFVKNAGCNFCLLQYNTETHKMVSTYEFVWGIQRDSGNSLYATICPNCLEELKAKTNLKFANSLEFTQGICEDGAAILCNGQPLKVEEILNLLRGLNCLMNLRG